LSVVVACRDDAATAARAIRHAARAAARTSQDYELLLIDDASSDATAEVVARFARPVGRARALLHADRRGGGTTLRTGLAASSMPWVLLLDATDELDLDRLEDFLPLAADHDVLLGWRVMRRGPATTRLNGAAWNALVRRVVGLPVRDVDCPLKLVRRELLDRLELRSPGAVFGAELVASARALSARVTDVPVHQRGELAAPGKSGPSPPLTPGTLLALARLRRSSRKRPP
jgi:glycosyltransferase involved in cell wall biosynthesis